MSAGVVIYHACKINRDKITFLCLKLLACPEGIADTDN
jgi:hypothetical protein